MIDQEPIRILRIIARLNIGGPAIQAVTLASDLPADRYETMLVCGRVGFNEGDMAYLAAEKGVQPVYIQELGRDISLLDDLRCFMKVRTLMKQFKPHLVHTHTAKAGTIGRLAALSINLWRRSKRRIRTVHTFHGHVFHSYFSPLKTEIFIRIERFLSRFTDRIVAISPQQETDLCDRFKIAPAHKVVILPLGFDLTGFKACEARRRETRSAPSANDPESPFVIGIVGRLTPIKNHMMLLDTMKLLKDRGKLHEFRLFIVGDGELRPSLEKEVQALGLRDAVVFTGWKKDMPAVYDGLDGVVLTSHNEGTPVTVIEAMASKKPVIATDVGGVKDLLGEVRETNPGGVQVTARGIMVPPQDQEALANALLLLLENRELSMRMGEESMHFVLSRYSQERLLNDVVLLYNEIL